MNFVIGWKRGEQVKMNIEERIWEIRNDYVIQIGLTPNLMIMPVNDYEDLRRETISKSRQAIGQVFQYMGMNIIVSQKIPGIEVLREDWVDTHCKKY